MTFQCLDDVVKAAKLRLGDVSDNFAPHILGICSFPVSTQGSLHVFATLAHDSTPQVRESCPYHFPKEVPSEVQESHHPCPKKRACSLVGPCRTTGSSPRSRWGTSPASSEWLAARSAPEPRWSHLSGRRSTCCPSRRSPTPNPSASWTWVVLSGDL